MARVGLVASRVTTAAADLADKVGFDKVTLSAVARILGIAEPSMYSHVRSVAELRKGVAVLAATELADCIGEALAGRAGKDALVAFSNAYREFARTCPGRYTATHIQLTEEELSRSTGHQRIFAMTMAMFRAYDLSEGELTDAVRLVRSSLHGFVSLESIGGFGHPRDVQKSWENGIEAIHVMLTEWPSSGAAR
ncbi:MULTISPECIES: TetR/AcrR family transcriptional regulator [Micromonospora]|uniref:WHG domain-containing protein n=1 Tax=Micromonospora antibiotica TaxID=2807623 RepID=A0ABS3V281_9ACTN|nr:MULTISPECIES: TetR/AcrR family transcriptional regulator [Micromonospora]MBO4159721.1 WHG domain-containing protein [Micromonospora antibiotica]MBW4704203.1 WHG domain-containing protein [Micromonospora sp. RL09-050-HVF-A]